MAGTSTSRVTVTVQFDLRIVTVPTVTCGAATSWETTWVGIDGQTNATVEQAGTSDVCQDGVPYYSAFYELWGYASEKNGGLSVSLPTRATGGARRLSVGRGLVRERTLGVYG